MPEQCVLNFSPADKPAISGFMLRFPPAETKTQFEESRVKAGGCTITLYTSGKVVIQGEGCEKLKGALLAELGNSNELVLGIDETGRGEKTGPFVISAALGETAKLRELRDSKKTRDIAGKYKTATANSLANATLSLNAEMLARLHARGITLNKAEEIFIDSAAELFSSLGEKTKTKVDGSPMRVRTKNAEFIVKGDDKEPVIGAASVIARHVRDISGDKRKRKGWGN
ncbi:MAG: DUF3378 domain-containing protein [Candidatus Diapherotrites archaeon]